MNKISSAESSRLTVTYRPLGDLIPDPRNARTHPKRQIDQIRASIEAFGFTNPILADAGPEQTRSKLFGYQPDPVGCHLILREEKPAERRPWRVRIACGPQCTQELRVVRNGTQELRVVRRGLEESCARLAGKGWPQLARTAERVREALRGLGGSVEVESYRGTAIE